MKRNIHDIIDDLVEQADEPTAKILREEIQPHIEHLEKHSHEAGQREALSRTALQAYRAFIEARDRFYLLRQASERADIALEDAQLQTAKSESSVSVPGKFSAQISGAQR